jgi:SAM-dependent methyltransferase
MEKITKVSSKIPYFSVTQGKIAMDYKNIVRSGYDKVADRYLAEREASAKDAENVRLLADFIELLSPKSRVLDAGCGAGIPIAKMLAEHFDVIGVDFSSEQIERAKRNVPNAHFFCQDMTELDFPDDSLDGICSYYAIIHIPREEHASLLTNFHRMLRAGGVALLCLGADDLDNDIDEEFLGTRMYWSHYDSETYRKMLRKSGFTIIWAKLVNDETHEGSKHLFVLAQKRS